MTKSLDQIRQEMSKLEDKYTDQVLGETGLVLWGLDGESVHIEADELIIQTLNVLIDGHMIQGHTRTMLTDIVQLYTEHCKHPIA